MVNTLSGDATPFGPHAGRETSDPIAHRDGATPNATRTGDGDPAEADLAWEPVCNCSRAERCVDGTVAAYDSIPSDRCVACGIEGPRSSPRRSSARSATHARTNAASRLPVWCDSASMTCLQDDECTKPRSCCQSGSAFEPGTSVTQTVCDELQGDSGRQSPIGAADRVPENSHLGP